MTEGIHATFTGTVTKVFDGRFKVDVTDGKRTHWVTVWAKGEQPAENQIVKVTGLVSREDDWTDKHGERRKGGLSCNRPTWEAANAPQSAPENDWASDSTIPF